MSLKYPDQAISGTVTKQRTQKSKVMVLPLLKLGTLALKTLSKPIAARLKKEAGLHPKFRHLIISMAQANHRMTTTMQRRLYGHATDVGIRPLNEEKAVQAAVDLLGEFFVFSVAVAALVFEVQRSARSEAKKEELRRQEMEVVLPYSSYFPLNKLFSMVHLLSKICTLSSLSEVSPFKFHLNLIALDDDNVH
nr:OPA3-like protein isoform X2 [Nicotiana tomentosiformis]